MADIKKATMDDLGTLYQIVHGMGHARESDYFELTLSMSDRILFLVEHDGQPAGYGILNWQPKYAYFASEGIPEVQDISILPDFRQRGLASTLIAHCEDLARSKGLNAMGIGVGLHTRFGPAQRLYAKLGYVPDGFGVTYDRQGVTAGEFKPVDDQLCIMMTKKL